jgi:hypothetical protein
VPRHRLSRRPNRWARVPPRGPPAPLVARPSRELRQRRSVRGAIAGSRRSRGPPREHRRQPLEQARSIRPRARYSDRVPPGLRDGLRLRQRRPLGEAVRRMPGESRRDRRARVHSWRERLLTHGRLDVHGGRRPRRLPGPAAKSCGCGLARYRSVRRGRLGAGPRVYVQCWGRERARSFGTFHIDNVTIG